MLILVGVIAMRSINIAKIQTFMVAVLCLGAAFVQLRLTPYNFDSLFRWPFQHYSLIGLSLICVVVQMGTNSDVINGFLIFCQFLIYLILGVPLVHSQSIEILLLIPVLFSVGALRSPRNEIFTVGMIGIALLAQRPDIFRGPQVPGEEAKDILSFGIQIAVIGFLACKVRQEKAQIQHQMETIQSLNGALSKLSRVNVNLQEYAIRRSRRDAHTERLRISREIHDSVGYVLTNILMMVKTCLLFAEGTDGRLKEILVKTARQAEDGIVEVRSTLQGLRRQHRSVDQGQGAVNRLIQTFSEVTGMKISVEYGNVFKNLGPELELFIYRMIQEGILNAFRHGEADQIRIVFRQESDSLRIIISDNGKGCRVVKKKIGLTGMEERLQKMKGQLIIMSSDAVFEITAIIPLQGKNGG
jgi:signal transduction histidine kinase